MSNATYHVYIGTSSEPVGCGATKEEAIADALRELNYAGFIGDGHGGMFSTEDAARAAMMVELSLWTGKCKKFKSKELHAYERGRQRGYELGAEAASVEEDR